MATRSGLAGRRFTLQAVAVAAAVLLVSGCAASIRVIYLNDLQAADPNATASTPEASVSGAGPSSASPSSTHTNSGPGPKIDLWYGPDQTFGTHGVPQRWINIVGNVSDPAGFAKLTFDFDGSGSYPVTVGPDNYRLVAAGDFNIALDRTSVPIGVSTLTLHAVNALGNTSDAPVRIHVESAPTTWPMPYTSDWTQGPTSAGQVVDGRWTVTAQGIRTTEVGYDRVVAVGDVGWHDYRVTVPFVVNGLAPTANTEIATAVGWTGHDNTDGNHEPLTGHSFGGLCDYYRVTPQQPMALRILANGDPIAATHATGFAVQTGQTYVMSFQTKTLGGGQASYSCKIWQSGQPEPAGWTVSATLPARNGSMLVVADNADVTFGNVTVVPAS